MQTVNLAEQLARIDQPWTPLTIAALNGQHVKLARFLGTFPWHRHAAEDELFLVLRGRIRLELRDRVVPLEAGELFVVPRGVEHRPVADEEAEVLLFEPASTVKLGDAPPPA